MGVLEVARGYNRQSFTSAGLPEADDLATLDFQPRLHVGMEAPDFAVTDLDGSTVRLSDFRGKTPVFFQFGCITGPSFINDVPHLKALYQELGHRGMRFLVIYTREAHPGEHYPHHTSLAQKIAQARDLKRLEGIEFPVLVDSLEGDAHRAYGLFPNPLYAVDREGRLTYKSSWLAPDLVACALRHLLQSDAVRADGARRQAYSETWTQLFVQPPYARVLARSGPKAREDIVNAFGFDPTLPETVERS